MSKTKVKIRKWARMFGESNPSKRQEVKQKISITLKEGYATGKIKHGFIGKHHTEETKKKMSEKANLRWQNPEQITKMKQIVHTPEWNEKIRKTLTGKYTGHHNPFFGKHLSKKTRELLSAKAKIRWQDPKFRDRVIKAAMKGLNIRPTSLERQMIHLIEKYHLPYKYTGDGTFLIGYKNPDFVNINGEKICIEVANTFHHAEDYEEKRKEHFRKWGWKCIIFRTTDKYDKLKENEVLGVLRCP